MIPHNPMSISRMDLRKPNLSTSITQVRMNPQDGTGYGRSMNWHYVAVNKADKTNEKCDHMDKTREKFDINHIRITMSPIEEGKGNKIKFKVTCSQCDNQFPLTSEKLTKKFIKFYGL